jgi:hypothetical protein
MVVLKDVPKVEAATYSCLHKRLKKPYFFVDISVQMLLIGVIVEATASSFDRPIHKLQQSVLQLQPQRRKQLVVLRWPCEVAEA